MVVLVMLVMVVVVMLAVRSQSRCRGAEESQENPGVVWAQLQSYCLSGCETQSARL